MQIRVLLVLFVLAGAASAEYRPVSDATVPPTTTVVPFDADAAVARATAAGDNGDFALAEAELARAIEALVPALGSDHDRILELSEWRAQALSRMDAHDEALDLRRDLLARRQRISGVEAEETLAAMEALAWTLYDLERFEQVEPLERQLVELREGVLGPEHPETLRSVSSLGYTLRRLGRADEAAEQFGRALSTQERTLGPDHPDTLYSLTALASTLYELGRLDEAEPLERRVATARERTLGPEHPDTLRALNNHGFTLNRLGRYDEAADVHRSLLSIRDRSLGPDHSDTLISVGNLAGALFNAGAYAEAEQLERRLLAARERVFGPDHPRTLSALSNLSTTLGRLGRPAEAETLLRRVLAVRRSVLGPEHPDTLLTLNNLASSLDKLGRLSEAAEIHREVYAAARRTLGPDHPNTLTSLNNLAGTLADLGEYSEAEEYFREVVASRQRSLGPEHPDTLSSLSDLASLLDDLGYIHEAERLDRRLVEARERILGPEHPDTLLSLNNLAYTLNTLGRAEEAEAIERRVLSTRTRLYGPDHPDTLTSSNNLAGTLVNLGRLTEAEEIFRRISSTRERLLGPEHPDTLRSMNNLASFLDRTGRSAEAEPLDRHVFSTSERVLGPEHPSTLKSLNNLASTLGSLGRWPEAEALDRRVVGIRERVLGPNHPDTLNSLSNLAVTLNRMGRPEDAEPINRRVLAAREQLFGPHHPDTLLSLGNLASTLDALGRGDEAVRMERQVLASRERVQGLDHPATLLAANNLAMTLSGSDHHVEAAAIARRVVEGRERVLGSDHPDTLVGYQNLAGVLFDHGDIAGAIGPARRGFFGALGAAQDQGAAEATRTALASDARGAGAFLARVSWTLAAAGGGIAPEDRPDQLRAEAFEAAQAGDARTANALARATGRIAADEQGLANVVAEWERALVAREHLDRQISVLAANTDANEAARTETRARLFADRAEQDARRAAAEAKLKDAFPRFFDLTNPMPVSLSELQGDDGDTQDGGALLGPDEALVLLTPGYVGENGLVWAVSRERVAWAEIPVSPRELGRMIGRFHEMLAGGRSTADDPRAAVPIHEQKAGFDRTLAHGLYTALFGAPEVAAVLDDKPQWILAPQGVFLSLPFAALVGEPPQGADDDPDALRKTSWLGIQRALAVVPSVATVRSLRRGSKTSSAARTPFFGVGDPAFSGAPSDRSAISDAHAYFRDALGHAGAVRELPRLPGTRREVEAMAATFGVGPASYLLGAEANETSLARLSKDGKLEEARVVLLATHGLMAGAFDGLTEPALALSPPEDGPRPIDEVPSGLPLSSAAAQGARIDDGLLTASEAARLDLNADWVILSACDTAAGAGDTPDAEGLSGLARAFFYAGARSLLVSHWPVEDDTAARLTTDAVSRAEADPTLTRAEALRDAMRALVHDRSADRNADPSRWAPFQLVGID